jgi:hypothetical protein
VLGPQWWDFKLHALRFDAIVFAGQGSSRRMFLWIARDSPGLPELRALRNAKVAPQGSRQIIPFNLQLFVIVFLPVAGTVVDRRRAHAVVDREPAFSSRLPIDPEESFTATVCTNRYDEAGRTFRYAPPVERP